jgi:shikimate kinase
MGEYMKNIILTGMPGAGKSTIGPALASELGMGFADTDELIREARGMELGEMVASLGRQEFMRIQDDVILSTELENHVIATGGSVACSDAAMEHLRRNGIAVYLKYSAEAIESRFDQGRKLARKDGQDLAALLAERAPYYEKNSDFTVDCTGKSINDILHLIKDII